MIKQILLIFSVFIFYSAIFAQQIENKQSVSVIPNSCELITLYDANDFNLKGSELFLNWYGDPYIIKGSTIAALLPDSTLSLFELPDKSSPTQIFCTPSGITYLKNNNLLQIMEDDTIRTLLKLKNDKFKVSLANDRLFYIIAYDNDSSTVFLFNAGSLQIIKLINVAGKINGITGNGDITYMAIDDKVFLLSDDIVLQIMEIEQPITMLAGSEYGLFFSTETNIGYIVNSYQPFPFISKPAKKLLPLKNQMYIQFEDGTISILFGLEYFENFVNSIYNDN